MFFNVLRPLARLTAGLSLFTAVLAVGFDRRSADAATPTPAAAPKDEQPAAVPGLVKWHASFAKAKAASLKSGKPVLLFHLGQIDTPSRGVPTVGVMLFSSLEVADYINANFEPVWENSLRASLSLVDFGAVKWGYPGTYICASDGVVYDALIGTYPPNVYRKQLEESKKFADSLRPFTTTRGTPTEIERQRAALARDTRLREYHQRRQAELFGPATGLWPPQCKPFGGGANAFGFGCPNFPGFGSAFCCCGGINNYNGLGGYPAFFNVGSFGDFPPHSNLYSFGSFNGVSPLPSNGFGSCTGGFNGYYGFNPPGNFGGFQHPPSQGFGGAPFK